MVWGGFLNYEDPEALVALACDGLAEGRVSRGADSLVLSDDRVSLQQVGRPPHFDDDNIHRLHVLFEWGLIEGLTSFEIGGSSGRMSLVRAETLKAWVVARLQRSTRQAGAWIKKEFGLLYESLPRLIASRHRVPLEYHKPEVISRKLGEKTQKAFIGSYENTLDSMGDAEVLVYKHVGHPTHATQPRAAGRRSNRKASSNKHLGANAPTSMVQSTRKLVRPA
jgi:hypothetical protein